jgi:hypothetical protein
MSAKLEIRAREILWRMPQEVFDLYVLPLIGEYGWPFETESSPHNENWLSVFDRYPLKIIANLIWERRDVPLILPLFHKDTKLRIQGIVAAYSQGRNFARNSHQRYEGLLAYIRQHGVSPKPVVILNEGTKLRALDGNHRLAAAFTPGVNIRKIDAWVGGLRADFKQDSERR